jgi:hypothetical protein
MVLPWQVWFKQVVENLGIPCFPLDISLVSNVPCRRLRMTGESMEEFFQLASTRSVISQVSSLERQKSFQSSWAVKRCFWILFRDMLSSHARPGYGLMLACDTLTLRTCAVEPSGCRRTFWLPVIGPRKVVVSWIGCPDVRCLQSFLGTSVPSPTQAVLCFLGGFTTKELLVWPEVRKLCSRAPAWQVANSCSVWQPSAHTVAALNIQISIVQYLLLVFSR